MVEREYYDLTPSQNLMYYTLKVVPKKNIVNIGAAVWFQEDMDYQILKEAIYKAIWRMDALRLRLKNVDGKIKQYVSQEEPKEVKIQDYSELSKEKIDEILEKWTGIPFKYDDTELYDITIVKAPENLTALYIKVNHVIMDAWGLTVYAKDVINVYLAMKNKEQLPEPPVPFISLIKKDLEYMSSKKREKDFEFFKSKYSDLPQFASIEKKCVGKKFRPFSLRFKAKQKIISLDKDSVSKINKYCKENRVSQLVLFILSSQLYFYKLNNTDKSMINESLARRSSMDSKKAGGMMVNTLQLKVECPYDLSFKEACEKLSQEQLSLFRHGDFPYQISSSYLLEKSGVKSGMLTDFNITYQPAKIFTDDRIKAKIQSYCNGSTAMTVYLTIMDTLDSGVLDFVFEYRASVVNEEIIDEIYRVMTKSLEIGIQCPDKTIGEIINEVYA